MAPREYTVSGALPSSSIRCLRTSLLLGMKAHPAGELFRHNQSMLACFPKRKLKEHYSWFAFSSGDDAAPLDCYPYRTAGARWWASRGQRGCT